MKAITFVLLSAVGLSPFTAIAAPIANFTDGNTNAAIDGYLGMLGGGWNGAWGTNTASAGVFTNTVTNASPLNGGGNYLSASLGGTTTSANTGTINRQWDTSVIPLTAPYKLTFNYRVDAGYGPTNNPADTNTKYFISGDSAANATGLGSNNTWQIQGGYTTAAGVAWFYQNDTVVTAVPTSGAAGTFVPLVVGTTYTFAVTVNPVAFTYSFMLTDGINSFASGTLGFRNDVAGQNKVFFGATRDVDHVGSLAYSIDSIALTAVPEPATLGLAIVAAGGLLGRRRHE